MKKTILLISLLALALVGCVRVDMQDVVVDNDSVDVAATATPGVLVVKTKTELTELKSGQYTFHPAFNVGGRFEKRQREAGLHLWYVVSFDEDMPLTKASADIRDIEGIELVEYCPAIRQTAVFNDPEWARQWSLYNDGNTSVGRYFPMREGSDIHVTDAWDITTGTSDVIVAVADGGVDFNHEDLSQNMWVNTAELNGKLGVDDDGNGYVDDIYGYNFVQTSRDQMIGVIHPEDHGTHCAGVIAATNNNGIGISGVAGGNGDPSSGARIMSVQTSDEENGSSWYPMRAFQYAADNGAVIISCSWGFDNAKETPAVVRSGIEYFNKYAGFDENGVQTGPMAGGLCVFAAGNENSAVAYPAMDDDVLAVSSIGADFMASYFTNFGSWIDLAAPGGDARKGCQIYSTTPGNTYKEMQGTSMACPHVSGVAALVVSKYKGEGFTRERLIDILKSTANPVIYEYQSTPLGAGLVDAYAALTYNDAVPEKVENISVDGGPGTLVISFTEKASGNGAFPDYYDVFVSEKSLGALDVENPSEDVIVTTFNGSRKAESVSFTVEGLKFSTPYHVRISARNAAGKRSVLSDEIIGRSSANGKPEIIPSGQTDITLRSSEKAVIKFEVKDPDGHKVTCSIDENLPGATLRMAGRVANVMIDALEVEEGKKCTGALYASDGYDTVKYEFSYEVLRNSAPVLLSDLNDILIEDLHDKADIDLSQFFKDEDGDVLDYGLSVSENGIVVGAVNAGHLVLSPVAYGVSRLTVKARDPRGEEAESSCLVVVRDGRKEVDIYPNPVVDFMNIRTASVKFVDVSIHSASGAVMYSANSQPSGPFNPLKIDMTGMAAGEYYVRVKCEGLDKSYPVVKR